MRRRCSGLVVAALLGCGDNSAASSGQETAATGGTSDGSSSGQPTEGSSGATEGSGGATEGSGGATEGSGSSGGTGPAVTCTSQKYWTMGDLESPLMHPGRACLACHQTILGEDIATKLAIGGTVYPSLHEEDECYGLDGAGSPATVVITTADDKTLMLPVNSAGNFMYDQEEFGPIMFPIKAKVVHGDAEIAMAAPQMSGDCNSCHTELGMNGAPGRIYAP